MKATKKPYKDPKKDPSIPMSERYTLTIDRELFEAWGKLKAYGDPGKIATHLNISRPVIDRALNFGYVKKDKVSDGITKFFNDRLAREKRSGTKILKEVTEA